MKFNIVGRFTEGWFLYQGWPSAARAEDGTLYVVASGCRRDHVCPFGKNLMYVSRDNGESWDCPQIINDSPLDDRDAGLLAWGDGNLLLSWFCNEPGPIYTDPARTARWKNLTEECSVGMMKLWESVGPEYIGSFTKISRDGGKTWSKARRAPVTAPHGPIRRKDGTLLYVGTARNSGYDFIEEDEVYAFTSRDDGETWEFLSKLPAPKFFQGQPVTDICEPHVVDFGDGEVLAGIRCVTTGDENEIGASYRMTMYTCRSLDGGKTWEDAVFMERYGAPPHFMLHSSGALVLVCGRRVEPLGQVARVSYDRGRTWEEDIKIGPDTRVTDQGYPASVELDNGEIFTAYYQRYQDDPYCSILSTKWTLPEKK